MGEDKMAHAVKDTYPGPRTAPEVLRLRAQHYLTVSALDLQILDSGTADGFFLSELRSQLAHPETAQLVGTDIATYPQEVDLPSNIKLEHQSILEEWPKKWERVFDLVHQRHTMANARTFEEAIRVTQRLIRLAKPGGWIQIVDGSMPTTSIKPSDSPSMKMFKTMGSFLTAVGMDATLGTRLPEMMESAGGIANIGSKSGVSRLGSGAPTRELEELGYAQLRGLESAMTPALRKMQNPPMSADDFAALLPLALEEARTKGVDMHWFAAWGQRLNEPVTIS